jgi:hypothetical protein
MLSIKDWPFDAIQIVLAMILNRNSHEMIGSSKTMWGMEGLAPPISPKRIAGQPDDTALARPGRAFKPIPSFGS